MNDVRIVPRERRDRLGEGLLWSQREQALFWVDVLDRRVNRLMLADQRVASWVMPDRIGWLIERESGGFVAGVGRDFVALTLDQLRLETIASPEPDEDGHRLNDAKADPSGRIWAGSMRIAFDRPTGRLYRLDPDHGVTCVDRGYTIPNGPAIGDGFLLHADTALGTIFRYSIGEGGDLGPREPFIVFEPQWGQPDGMTFDADGCLWVACWRGGQVVRFDPTGRLERTIRLPTPQITNVTFAGDGLDRMFVTSASAGLDDDALAGCLFEVQPGCLGLEPCHFKG